MYAMGETNFFPELKEMGDVDTLVIIMRLENGAIAVIDNSRRRYMDLIRESRHLALRDA